MLLTVPNLLWTRRQPAGYAELAAQENRILVLLERIGQVWVTACTLFFRDFDVIALTPWSLWLAASLALMLLYEIAWVRYFTGGCTLKDFYGSLVGIPVPLAVLPVTAFLLLGIYDRVVWMIVGVVILGAGHIGIHWQHRKAVNLMISSAEDT